MQRLTNAVVTVVAIALGIRVAWFLIAPVFGLLIVLGFLVGIVTVAIRNR